MMFFVSLINWGRNRTGQAPARRSGSGDKRPYRPHPRSVSGEGSFGAEGLDERPRPPDRLHPSAAIPMDCGTRFCIQRPWRAWPLLSRHAGSPPERPANPIGLEMPSWRLARPRQGAQISSRSGWIGLLSSYWDKIVDARLRNAPQSAREGPGRPFMGPSVSDSGTAIKPALRDRQGNSAANWSARICMIGCFGC